MLDGPRLAGGQVGRPRIAPSEVIGEPDGPPAEAGRQRDDEDERSNGDRHDDEG